VAAVDGEYIAYDDEGMSSTSGRAVIYARISEDPLNTQKGVERQVEDCRELTLARGWDVITAPFVDNDVSALTGKARPAYLDLFALVDAGGVDHVVTYMTSRLWRNRRERAEGIERLREARTGVVAVKGPDLDLTTAAGRMLAGLLGEFDTHESEQKAERVARASEQRAAEGRPNGTIPFGWERIYNRDDRGRVLASRDVEHPAEGKIVQEIVDRLLAGDSLRAITSDLNARGLVSPQGKPWGSSSVRKIALREANVARRVHRGKVIGPAAWPALVDEDRHDRVVALLTDPRRDLVRGALRRHLLTFGIGECGVCGGRLRSVAAKRSRKVRRAVTEDNPEGIVTDIHTLYTCDVQGCVGRNQARVDELAVEVVLGRLARPDVLDLFDRDDKFARDLRAKAEAVRARLDTAADQYAEDVITADQLRRISERLRPGLDDLERQAAAAAGPGVDALAQIVGRPDVRAVWDGLPVSRQRAIIEALGMVVIILPTRKGPGFDPDYVRFKWAEDGILVPRVTVVDMGL